MVEKGTLLLLNICFAGVAFLEPLILRVKGRKKIIRACSGLQYPMGPMSTLSCQLAAVDTCQAKSCTIISGSCGQRWLLRGTFLTFLLYFSKNIFTQQKRIKYELK